MAWVKLDDQARQHRKILAVGPAAAWLWVCGLMYCNSQKARDGFIPAEAVPVLYPIPSWKKEAARLVEAGLWEPAQGGYLIHDYHDYQPTPERAQEISEAKAAAGRLGGKRSGESRRSKGEAKTKTHPEAKREAKREANAKQDASNDEAQREANAKQTRSKREASAKQDASLLRKPDPDPDPVLVNPTPTPPTGRGGGSVSGQAPMPRSEARQWGAWWHDEYTRLVTEALGKPVSWDPHRGRAALDRAVTTHCPPGRRRDPVDWLAELVPDFVETARENPKLYSCFSPAGFERWLNERAADDDSDAGTDEPPLVSEPERPPRVVLTPEQRARRMAQLAEIENDPAYQEKFL